MAKAKAKKSKKVATRKTRDSKAKTSATDIITLILADHKPLKKLIKILKDLEASVAERKAALREFNPLLTVHAHAEEKALYKVMEGKPDLREESFEGEVEHSLAEQMLDESVHEKNRDMWSAKVKVLAELVEHHIQEEEEEVLSDVRKQMKLELRQEIGEKYLQFKQSFEQGVPVHAEQAEVPADDENFSEGEEVVHPTH